MNLFSPVNATIVDDRATGTITDPGANFFTLTPCRVADTRGPSGPFGGPALVANTARDFQVTGQCGVPATAKAVAINVTIVDPDNSGELRIYPAGMAQPPVSSTIVFGPNQVRANNAVMPLSATGQMTVFCDMPSGLDELYLRRVRLLRIVPTPDIRARREVGAVAEPAPRGSLRERSRPTPREH